MPLYLHSMIAFAAIFLMKMSHRWRAIGTTIDPTRRTLLLVENTVRMLRSCKAGANHIVFRMAADFERMLQGLRKEEAEKTKATYSTEYMEDTTERNGREHRSSTIDTTVQQYPETSLRGYECAKWRGLDKLQRS